MKTVNVNSTIQDLPKSHKWKSIKANAGCDGSHGKKLESSMLGEISRKKKLNVFQIKQFNIE